jgi:hypothetical protein
MSAVHLMRIDPSRDMRRFYRLDVQPDLFGGFAVVKEWGRKTGGRRVALDRSAGSGGRGAPGRAQAAARLARRGLK